MCRKAVIGWLNPRQNGCRGDIRSWFAVHSVGRVMDRSEERLEEEEEEEVSNSPQPV